MLKVTPSYLQENQEECKNEQKLVFSKRKLELMLEVSRKQLNFLCNALVPGEKKTTYRSALLHL